MKVQKQEFKSLPILISVPEKHFGDEWKWVQMGEGSPRVKEGGEERDVKLEEIDGNGTEESGEERDELQFDMEMEKN